MNAWTSLRSRALGRLTKQATILGAEALIGVQAARRYEPFGEEGWAEGVVHFTGTAVKVNSWQKRRNPPVLTLVQGRSWD